MRMTYTDEMREFVKANAWGNTTLQLTQMFNKHFNTSISVKAMEGLKKRLHAPSGCNGWFPKGHIPYNKGVKRGNIYPSQFKTQFKKGSIPPNKKAMGTELLHKNGYIYVKVGYKKWKTKHTLLWEQAHNQEVPKGSIVIFLDNDITNFDIDNLAMVTRAEHLYLNECKRRAHSGEVAKSHLLLKRLDDKIKEES